MGPFDGMVGKGLKPLTAQKHNVHTQTVKAASASARQISTSKSGVSKSARSASPLVANGRSINGGARKPQKEMPSSRPDSKEPKARVRQDRPSGVKRSSPAVSTPRFDSDDSGDSADESEVLSNKRRRVETDASADMDRRIRDAQSFTDEEQAAFGMVHAADIANLGTDADPNPSYAVFFTALKGDEDEAPVIELQYPGAPQRERYQMVQGKGSDDFKPLDEIIQVINTVGEYYLTALQAEKICDEVTGLLRELKRARLLGHRGEIGAQSRYVDAVNQYSVYLDDLRRSGSIAKNIDQLYSLDLSLVETILQQIYARTVSPRIHTLRAYENGSDNVYGELLPGFCRTIFQKTQLKSSHVFVDLGSGVGNVVLQAALQTGCESWGCEMMPNASDLAALQQAEFTSRCRLWGLSAGQVQLEHGDFLANDAIAAALKRADVVLVNNQAFTPHLNDRLLMHFLDLRDGARVVSLKPFVPPGHRIQPRNLSSPINLLPHVAELEYFSNSVSWTDAPGKWYVHTKDSKPVRDFQRKMVRTSTSSKVKGGDFLNS